MNLQSKSKNAMTKNENKKARDRAMMLHRCFRVDAVSKIARRHGMMVALNFEKHTPVAFDVQVEPDHARMVCKMEVKRFGFFIYPN